MHPRTNGRFLIPALVAAAVLMLSACDNRDDTLRTLRIGNHAEPATLDPHRAEGVPERNIQRDLFEGLLRETPEGGYEPGVAESWRISDDGRTYIFTLRTDAHWSNGDPVTAEDFVFSFRRAAAPETGGIVTESLAPIENASAVIAGVLPPEELGVASRGERVLEIRLQQSTSYFLHLLTHPSTFPVHPPSVTEHPQWTRPGKLVSNGAYMLSDWRVQSAVTLVKNPHYWDAGNVAIERVQYLPIEDANAELARFEAGELDITYGIPSGRLNRMRQEFPDELRIAPWFGTYYLGINTTRAPYDDVRFRQALSLAVSREVLAHDVAGSGETPAYHWVPPLPGYDSPLPEWAGWNSSQREEAAGEMMAAAGVEAPVEVELLYNTRDRDQRIVTAVAAMWRRVLGIETRLRNEEWKVYLQSRQQLEETETFRSGWIGDYPDPFAFAELLHSRHGTNKFGWRNAEYDALIEAAAVALNEKERFRLLREAEKIVLEELPVIPLFHYSKVRLVDQRVGGYRTNPLDHHYTRSYYWTDQDNPDLP